MTKRIALFALLLVAAMGLQAQNIVGTWKTTMVDDGQKVDVNFVFTQSTLTMKTTVPYYDPEVGTITVSVELPGTYILSSNTLNVKIASAQGKVNLDKVEFVDEMAQMIKQNPEMKKLLEDSIQQSMQESQEELLSENPFGGQMTIVQLTDTKLDLREESGNTINLTRVR